MHNEDQQQLWIQKSKTTITICGEIIKPNPVKTFYPNGLYNKIKGFPQKTSLLQEINIFFRKQVENKRELKWQKSIITGIDLTHTFDVILLLSYTQEKVMSQRFNKETKKVRIKY